MPKFLDPKSKRVKYECWKCNKFLRHGEYACFECGLMDDDALADHKATIDLTPKQRMKKATKDFTQVFDAKILNFAREILESRKRLLIRELLDLFIEEGLFEGLDPRFEDMQGNIRYKMWAVNYTVKLAKVWHKNKEVFIGTRQIKGHPYEIYLPGHIEEIIEGMKIDEMSGDQVSPMDVFMPFGKHKSRRIQDIMTEDPGYIVWLYEKADLRESNLKKAVGICYFRIIKPK